MRAALRAAYASPAKAGAVALIAILLAFPKQMSPSDWNGAEEKLAGLYSLHGTIVLVAAWAAHVVLGVALGAAANLLLGFVDAASGRERSWRQRYAIIFVAVLAFELWQIAVCAVRFPQLYASWLYAKGGLREEAQVALTGRADAVVLERLGWLAIALVALAPLRHARGRALVGERRRAVGVTAAIIAAGIVVTHVSLPVPLTTDPRPNVLVIGVDGLRADRLDPRVAPRLAALRATGVSFDHAYVSLPRTFTSWTTLLTGRTPEHHGVRHMFPNEAKRRAIGETLPRILRGLGWQARVETQNGPTPLWAIDFGFENVTRLRGTDVRFEITGVLTQRHAALLPFTTTSLAHALFPPLAQDWSCSEPERLADRVVPRLLGEAKRAPFFEVVFFNTPHMPYAAPDPWYRKFTRPDYEGPYKYECYAYQNGGAWTDADIEQARGLYDGSVAATDAAIGRILDALEASGLARKTIIVVLGDHGENLGEPGCGFGHGEHLRGEWATRIPLVIVDPIHKFPPHAVPGIVRDVDVGPTIAALVSATLPGADGVDLGAMLRGEKADLDLVACHETELPFGPEERVAIEAIPFPAFPDYLVLEGDEAALAPELEDLVAFVKHRAVREGHWKVTYRPTRREAAWKLFDLATDPGERTDLKGADPATFERVRGRLVASLAATGWSLRDGYLVPRPDFAIPR